MKNGVLILMLGSVVLGGLLIRVPETHAAVSAGQSMGTHDITVPDLRDTLTNGLRATRQDQRDFIDRVVRYVERGKIPAALVYASFRWARKRYPDHPFPYFVQALRQLAKRYHVYL